ISLSSDATAEDFERALDEAIDHPSADAVIAVFIPVLTTSGEQVANVLAAVGEQSDKPLVSTFLGSEGVPELLRVPDLEGAAGRGSVPSYAAPEAAVRALSRVVTYGQWVNRPQGTVPVFDDIRHAAARNFVARVLREHPDGVDLDDATLEQLLGNYGVTVEPLVRVTTLDEAVAAADGFGWDVVLKATADHLRQRPDLAHVWRNIDTPADMTDAWDNLNELIDDSAHADFVVQPMADPGIPIAIGALEDPLFGPIVSFGMAGTPSELLGDVSYRIPPLTDSDASDLVRDVRAAPLFFGYRGSEPIDVPAVEELIHRLAQLKDDIPEVQVLDLSLVLAGAEGAKVLRASGRLSPVTDARSDWFTRRMSGPTSADDTLITGIAGVLGGAGTTGTGR
ncbi:MAG: acetate--CoA ligase family protein, partial [Nocardioidaceae bacterium]